MQSDCCLPSVNTLITTAQLQEAAVEYIVLAPGRGGAGDTSYQVIKLISQEEDNRTASRMETYSLLSAPL